MGWLIRTVAALVQWAIYVPLWIIGSKTTSLAVLVLWFGAIFISLNFDADARPFALVVGMAGLGLYLAMLFCHVLTRNIWRPAGLTLPTRRAQEAAAKTHKQPTWTRAAQATDAPSVEASRARLAPRLQLLMKPVPFSGRPISES